MLRRRFMFNSCRWLWRKIIEKVMLKSSMSQAPTETIEIDDSIGNPDNDISLIANDVSDFKINRFLSISRLVAPYARLRADPVFIRDITIIRICNMMTALAKICRFLGQQTIKRVSNLIMCLTYLTSYKVHIIPIVTVDGIMADTVATISKTQKIESKSNVLVDYSNLIKTISIDLLIPTDNNYVKLAYWLDPILEDGVLTILQSYDAIQTEEALEVI